MKKPKTFPDANPPWHSIALALFVLAICITSIPNIASSIDTVATIETCATPLFPTFISRTTLGWIRLSFALFIFSLTLVGMSKRTYMVQVNYLKASKLSSLPMNMGGLKSQAFFTTWSWNILGLSFASSGLVTLYIDQQLSTSSGGNEIQMLQMLSSQIYLKYALRASMLLFEIAAPISMLVSAVVRYALWPVALKGNGTDGFKETRVLIQHNANIIMSLIEVGLLGGMKVRFTDLALAPLFGLSYILFAWTMKNQWLKSGEPQFLYFFLDTTLGKTTSIALVLLVLVLTLFFTIFVLIEDMIVFLGGGLVVHFCVVTGIASLTCRFRD